MTNPSTDWARPTHVLVRERSDPGFTIPGWVEVGDRVIGLVATDLWAIDGVYDVVGGARRRSDAELRGSEPAVDHCGVSLTAVEARARRALPRNMTTLHGAHADLVIAAIRCESISPTPWYRVDHRCSGRELTAYDASIARVWGCNTCGRDPRTEYTPRFGAHATGLRIDPRIDLDITIAVCPSCHDILHQPIAPTASELMYGMRPSCPRCGARHADLVTVNHADAPLPIGVVASPSLSDHVPDFHCGVCDHEW
ncbi:MAG: hypothetical protein PGN29_08635 [Gordonia paraffinivorans]